MANTLDAPFCNAQSVKPPVLAPISTMTASCKSIGYIWIAFSNLSPPRLTYGKVLPFTRILASTGTFVPALSMRVVSIKISPAMIAAFAFSLLSKSPRLTRSISNRSLLLIVHHYKYNKTEYRLREYLELNHQIPPQGYVLITL